MSSGHTEDGEERTTLDTLSRLRVVTDYCHDNAIEEVMLLAF